MTLPDLNESDWEDIYTQIARELLEEKRDKGHINKDLYFKTATKLVDGMNKGLGGSAFKHDDTINNLSSYLKHNLYSFSAAKSLTEMVHFRDLMIDAKGNILSFAKFRALIANEGYHFNNSYLKTEYNTALQSAIMAKKWHTLDSEFLEFRTVGDDRVRYSHALLDGLTLPKSSPVWHKLWTPLDWNCRCNIVPGIESKVTMTDAEAGKLAKETITNPLFDNNVGLSQVIFKNEHPYFLAANGKESQLSFERYGLDSLEKIKTSYELNTYPKKTINEYNDWWKNNADVDGNIFVGDYFGNEIKFPAKFQKHINESEARFVYGTELKTIVEQPDEIWSSIDPKNNKLNTFYLKFYEPQNNYTGVIAVFVDDNQADSMYEITTEARLKEIRRGILQYTSKK